MRVCEVCACESVGLYLCTCVKARGQHCVSPCLIAHLILVRQDSPHPELGQQPSSPSIPCVSSLLGAGFAGCSGPGLGAGSSRLCNKPSWPLSSLSTPAFPPLTSFYQVLCHSNKTLAGRDRTLGNMSHNKSSSGLF